jgi:hypothetical protein
LRCTAEYTDNEIVRRQEYRISEVPRIFDDGIQIGAISLFGAVVLPTGTGDPGGKRGSGEPCAVGKVSKTHRIYKIVLMMNDCDSSFANLHLWRQADFYFTSERWKQFLMYSARWPAQTQANKEPVARPTGAVESQPYLLVVSSPRKAWRTWQPAQWLKLAAAKYCVHT